MHCGRKYPSTVVIHHRKLPLPTKAQLPPGLDISRHGEHGSPSINYVRRWDDARQIQRNRGIPDDKDTKIRFTKSLSLNNIHKPLRFTSILNALFIATNLIVLVELRPCLVTIDIKWEIDIHVVEVWVCMKEDSILPKIQTQGLGRLL